MTSPPYEQLELSFDTELTTAERFEAFNLANPHVLDTMTALGRQWRARHGPDAKIGISALYERARWEISFFTKDPDFKLNNDFRAYYARLIMLREPDLAGLFELRKSEADEWARTIRGAA